MVLPDTLNIFSWWNPAPEVTVTLLRVSKISRPLSVRCNARLRNDFRKPISTDPFGFVYPCEMICLEL